MKLVAHSLSRQTASHPSSAATRRSPVLRLRVLLSRWRLDCDLAAGRPPESSDLLALRARQLASRDVRRRLAGSLRRAVELSGRPRGIAGSAVIAAHPRALEGWGHGLLGLAERLEQPEPIRAEALARVQVLLCDGTGPLFSDRAKGSLGDTIWGIADALAQFCPPHEWGCPVIMKLDPDHVAWTCAHCGVMAFSHDLASRPE